MKDIIEAGNVTPVIDRTYALSEAPRRRGGRRGCCVTEANVTFGPTLADLRPGMLNQRISPGRSW